LSRKTGSTAKGGKKVGKEFLRNIRRHCLQWKNPASSSSLIKEVLERLGKKQMAKNATEGP